MKSDDCIYHTRLGPDHDEPTEEEIVERAQQIGELVKVAERKLAEAHAAAPTSAQGYCPMCKTFSVLPNHCDNCGGNLTVASAQAGPELLPCPFCGSIKITASEGSTFRWVVATCGDCEASCGEVRAYDDHTLSNPNLIQAWNTRASRPDEAEEV